MKQNKVSKLFVVAISMATFLFLVFPTESNAFRLKGVDSNRSINPTLISARSNWAVNITYKDLNGGAPKQNDIFEFTVTANGLPTDPTVGVYLSSYIWPTDPYGDVTLTQIPNCGVTDFSYDKYMVITIAPRADSGCPFVNSAVVKFTAPLLYAPHGTLITRSGHANWFPSGANCVPHNCWPYNHIDDAVQFRMGYVPYLITAY